MTDFIIKLDSNEQEKCSDLKQKSLELKDTINKLRKNLDETRTVFYGYKTNVDNYVKKLFECNKMILKEHEISRKVLYEKIVVQVGILLNENSGQELVPDLDENFVIGLKQKIDQYKKVQVDKLAKFKQNNNAENQIKFNEAINRVVIAKDKKIEELNQLQKNHIEKISNLELEIKKLKIKLTETSVSMVNSQIDTNKTTNELLNCDQIETNAKLKELMLQEKINELKKQLDMFHTLPVTNNFYETIQINSCNTDDLVLAVYSEEHSSYRVVYKMSNYLHFVYSAVFKNYEHKLCIKANNSGSKLNNNGTSQYSSSPQNDQSDIVHLNENASNSQDDNQQVQSVLNSVQIDNTSADYSENIFNGDKQPQWFVGKVLVKEFCVARRVLFNKYYILSKFNILIFKENNRFKVSAGTRFYRVKLKPYNLF